MTGEFSLIEKYFAQHAQPHSRQILLGIGDDAAVLSIDPGQQLVTTMDTLVAGRHFPASTDPADIGYKSLAVNVSDLVAMAARPFYFLLSLTLPQMDANFLRAFSQGLFAAANEYGIELVGGDTCRGALSISVQASGLVDGGQYVTRGGASVGDRIFVSGPLGAAALGLLHVQQTIDLPGDEQADCLQALNRPSARVDLNDLLRLFATASIDVSDGLVADLGHILQRSHVGAMLDQHNIPMHPAVKKHQRLDLALTGGDDYQIVFTTASENVEPMRHLAQKSAINLHEIGVVTATGYHLKTSDGLQDLSTTRGFDHFGA